MSNALLLSIILIEGFVTISAEILTMRQLLPFVGNNVIVTSLIIGIFLLFLAYGYKKGGDYQGNFIPVLKRNFALSAALLGIGLSYSFILLFFSVINHHIGEKSYFLSLGLYLLLVTAPLVYVLGQTVPITMNLIKSSKTGATGATATGEIGGKVLHLSTLGSFFGAVLTSLLLMNFLGVAWTVFFNFVLLLFLTLLLFSNLKQDLIRTLCLFVLLIFVYFFNVDFEKKNFISTNHLANYEIIQDKGNENESIGVGEGDGMDENKEDAKILVINRSISSSLNIKNEALPYMELIKKVLFKDLNLTDKEILVLGAGGFSLSAESSHENHFTYVDIDQNIKGLVEKDFLKTISGQFIANDARLYLLKNSKKYDVIVSDAYSHTKSIPQHLITQEYYRLINQNLSEKGIGILNIIARPTLEDSYSKRMDNTIRSVFSNCMTIPLRYTDNISNIIYVCRKNLEQVPNAMDASEKAKNTIYADDLNQSALDVSQ